MLKPAHYHSGKDFSFRQMQPLSYSFIEKSTNIAQSFSSLFAPFRSGVRIIFSCPPLISRKVSLVYYFASYELLPSEGGVSKSNWLFFSVISEVQGESRSSQIPMIIPSKTTISQFFRNVEYYID